MGIGNSKKQVGAKDFAEKLNNVSQGLNS